MTELFVAAPVLLAQSGETGGLLANPWICAVFSAASLAIGIWRPPQEHWQAALLAVGGGSLEIGRAHV